jgi:PAS domain S-box-containing protein
MNMEPLNTLTFASHPDGQTELSERRSPTEAQPVSTSDAEAILSGLAAVFLNNMAAPSAPSEVSGIRHQGTNGQETLPQPEDMYRVLVEQIPALVFIAYLDRGISKAYVSPQIESALGFTQEEWLEDPIRWYGQIHTDDKDRWSRDAAQMFVTGDPLKAAYRVIARNGKVVWFQCEVKMVRRPDGRPWFLHGVGFDITELKEAEEGFLEQAAALQNLSTRLLRLQDEERRRLGRELHDSLGQYLCALKMNLDQLPKVGSARAAVLQAECDEIVDLCIRETRTLSHLLHPPLLDELGFVAAARWYVEGFASRSGIQVRLDLLSESERLPAVLEVVLFRILQESLTNIHRHSGSSSADVHLRIGQAEVSLLIRDYGRGMPPEILKQFQATGGQAGIGLSGMRERVKELNGAMEIRSDSEGTIVRVTVPVVSKAKQQAYGV